MRPKTVGGHWPNTCIDSLGIQASSVCDHLPPETVALRFFDTLWDPFGGKSHTPPTDLERLFDHLALPGPIWLVSVDSICLTERFIMFLCFGGIDFGIIVDDLLIPFSFAHATF